MTPARPIFALLRALGNAKRRLALSAIVLVVERLALAAAAFEAAEERASVATLAVVGLAGAFFVHSVLRSSLQLETRSRLLSTTTAALLVESGPCPERRTEETELALVDGLYASEAVLGDHIPGLLGDLPACVFMVVLACVTLPLRLVAEGAAATLVGMLAMLLARGLASARADQAWEAYAPMLDDLSAAARAGDEIVANGTGKDLILSLGAKLSRWRSLAARASLTSFLAGRAPAVAVAAAAGLVLVLDDSLRGSMAQGVLGRAALLASMTPPFAGLAHAWLEIGKSSARVRPVVALLERARIRLPRGDAPPPLPAVIALEHVQFAYDPGGAPVLTDLVAMFHPGQVTALAGPNGSGKSTVLLLLLGLARPTRGAVSVAAVDLSTLDLQAWRKRVGYLSQRPFLPERATAREAMRLLAPDADDKELERVLLQVKLWSVLVSHTADAPLETKVGSLSAGEKQRLALARVLARRPSMLFLDEPDANLDAEGLELVASLLVELAEGRVVVVAAHSPRLVSAAHRVLSLGGEAGVRVASPGSLGPVATASPLGSPA